MSPICIGSTTVIIGTAQESYFSKAQVLSRRFTLTPIAPLADGNSYTAIVCPGLYSSDQKFMTFTVNGTDNLTVLAKVSSPIEIEAAKHYTFNFTVGKEAATISRVEVIPWAKKEIDGGVATEEIATE